MKPKVEGRTQLVGYAYGHGLVQKIGEARKMDLEALRRIVELHRQAVAAQNKRDGIAAPSEGHEVHSRHCCLVHGCKYTTDPSDCPVMTKKVLRERDAGWCQEPGMVDDPESCREHGEKMPAADYHK